MRLRVERLSIAKSFLKACLTRVPLCLLALLASLTFVSAKAEAQRSAEFRGPYAALGAGALLYEGDEELESGGLYEGTVGYRFHPHWAAEGSVGLMPHLDNNTFDDPRFALNDDVFGVKLGGAALFFLRPNRDSSWDPYLSAGGGVNLYDEDLEDNQRADPFGTLGGGAFMHLSRGWFVRGDYKAALTGHDTEINHHALLSVGYDWGRRAWQRGGRESQEEGSMMSSERHSALSPVYFAFDSARLDDSAQQTLRRNAEWLKENPDDRVMVEGHCDERGTNEYNMALGQRRADSAFNFLRSLGVRADRLETISYGEERPVDPGHDEEAWSKNRRAEFTRGR